MIPPSYSNFEEKNESFCKNFRIDRKEDIDNIINMYLSYGNDCLYRGINIATYKLYSSSQVQWMLSDAISKRPSIEDYYNFIIDSIKLTRGIDSVKRYIKDNEISDNDVFILALMQHYGMPSPVLDFSHSVLNALYFAWYEYDRNLSSTKNNLSDYVSLYVINRNVDWVRYSVQKYMKDGADAINRQLSGDDLFKTNDVETENVKNEFLRLPYSKFKDMHFIAVDDNPMNPVKISIPILNFECEYQIINDRIISQQGMFIANITLDTPLVELMNDLCKKKHFVCYNIHKNLLDYIKKEYLDKNNINDEVLYCKKNSIVKDLEEAISQLKDKVLKTLNT